MPTMSEATFRSTTVCRLAGITFRQLDYWARTGLIPPSVAARGSGTQRRYTFRETVLVTMVADLLAHGISLPRARRVVDAVADRDDLTDVMLFVSGPDEIRAVTNAEEIIDALLTGTGPVASMVSLDRIAERLDQRAPSAELASA